MSWARLVAWRVEWLCPKMFESWSPVHEHLGHRDRFGRNAERGAISGGVGDGYAVWGRSKPPQGGCSAFWGLAPPASGTVGSG